MSVSPRLLKGAIIQFRAGLIVPIPNIIVFQYNPELLSRTLVPFDAEAAGQKSGAAPTADGTNAPTGPHDQPFDPTEQLNLTLLFDAADLLEQPELHAGVFVTGVADRIAALETLLYPVNTGLTSSLIGSRKVSLGPVRFGAQATVEAVPNKEVPVILFVWGLGRIVPVRLTTFAVDELQQNPLLYPHRARVTIGMKVITAESLEADKDTADSTGKAIAKFAYKFTQKQKQVLALANIAHTVESTIGLWPF
jgi:hypothetical protein